MSLAYAMGRLVSAANRHGVYLDHASGPSVVLPAAVKDAFASVLEGEEEAARLLRVEALTSPQVTALTSALNRRADALQHRTLEGAKL